MRRRKSTQLGGGRGASGAHKRPVRVLLIEDSPEQAAVQRAVLESDGLQVDEARDLAQGLEHVRASEAADQAVALVVLDLGLPDAFGLQAVHGVAALDQAPPFVVLTATDDPELAHAAVQLGAQDVLVKGRDDARLAAASRYAIERHARLLRLERDVAHLERLLEAVPDPLLVLDGHQRVVRANAAAAELYGRTPDMLRGKELHAPVPDGGRVQLRVTRTGGKEKRAVATGRWLTEGDTTWRLVSIREEADGAG